jgi:hypothetical protein
MRRYYKLVIIIFALFCLFTGCFSSTADNASPKAVLKNDPNADFFIMESTVYINAASIDWVKELSLNVDVLLGTIKNTGVKKNFKDWDATILDIGTEIYKAENRNDIVLVKVGERYLPYLRYVEG